MNMSSVSTQSWKPGFAGFDRAHVVRVGALAVAKDEIDEAPAWHKVRQAIADEVDASAVILGPQVRIARHGSGQGHGVAGA